MFVTSWGHAKEHTVHALFRNKATADILLAKNPSGSKFDIHALGARPTIATAGDQLGQKKEDN
jgi:hypothetical protein